MERAEVDRIVDGRYAVLLVGEEETELIVELTCLQPELRQLLRPAAKLRVQLVDGRLVAAQADPETEEADAQRIRTKLEQLRQRGRRGRQAGED